jgi:hypothetical protein
MFRNLLLASIPSLALVGCLNESVENPTKSTPEVEQSESTLELKSLETPVQIRVGSKSITVYRSPDGVEVIEATQPKGETSLLTQAMSGKTWKEIAESFGAGGEVAPSYANEIYKGERGVPAFVDMAPNEGQLNESLNSGVLGKKSADAGWFQANFCTVGSTFSWCLLNRFGGNDWGQTNAKFSIAHIVMNSGTQVGFTIKSGSKRTLTTTILNDNIVHKFETSSSKSWGLYNRETHRYDITNSNIPANNWHWSCAAYTW